MADEHIIIADELFDHSIEPTRISRHETIRNRVRGTFTQLVFYDEGYVRVREARKGKKRHEHLIELRFLDPDPLPSRATATGFLWSALVLAFLAMLTAFLLPSTSLSQYAHSATVGLATLATIALLFFVYRSEIRYQFFTASGQAVVLTLTGSLGCIRRTRSAAQTLRKAINGMRKNASTQDEEYLRAETKAHYKLAETGVITRKECADGINLILSKFN